MVRTYMITSIIQAVDVATTLYKSWFRGESKIYGELVPAIFRMDQDHIDLQPEDMEFYLIEAFKRGAPTLADKLPDQEDHLEWLFLMQHHGTPTRLLDWTESALIALYFAVSNNQSDDGELWAMYPGSLNKQSDIAGIPTLNNPILLYLAAEPLHYDRKKLAEKLGLEKIPDLPVAFQPPMNSPRMLSQLSAFTIHPKSRPGLGITELLQDEKSLVRYIIPGENKKRLLLDLSALGITRRTLFQDLDSLSISLKKEARIGAYYLPEPPICDGEYRS